MISWIRKFKRHFQSASTFRKILYFGISLFFLWIFGVLDKAREKSFDEFEWPISQEKNEFTSRFTNYPKCKFSENPSKKLLIIVKSAAKNVQLRESVRKTWGKYQEIGNFEVSPIFIVGHVENQEIRRKIDREAEEFEDLLRISATDSYRNNTYKLFGAIDYSAKPFECSNTNFILLVDDDYMVHIPNLIKFSEDKSENEAIYEGFVFDTSPFRMKIHKHSISLSEYPFSRYPRYVSAGAVFLTSKTISLFQNSMRNLKMFPFDDVFTGILAKTVGVEAIHNENFVFWSRRISPEEWNEGVIAVHGFAREDLEYEYRRVFG